MVFTLQRYIFRELFRIFVLATVGLTLILSLGGILSPVQEYGVGPQQVVHILLYFMPITLTFVLPMAALFASALAYGRFAGDNELDACRASGIGMPTLVYPGLALAVFVAIANLLLSFHVMPYFVHLAEKSLKADAKQILFRNIQRKGFYSLPPEGRYLIYADHADLKTDALSGIVVVQRDEGTIKRIITSELTKVKFDPKDKYNEVQLTIYNSKQMGDAADDLWWQTQLLSLKKEFGSLLGDDIKFKKIDEMKRIRVDLMQFDPVAKMVRAAHTQLVTELLAKDLRARLGSSPVAFYRLNGPDRTVRFSAPGCSVDKEADITLAGPVVVEEYDSHSGECLRRLRCGKAEIHVEVDPVSLVPALSLDLFSPRVEETSLQLVRCVVDGLVLPTAVAQGLAGESLLDIVEPNNVAALLGGPPSAILAKQQEELIEESTDTLTDIRAEINSRLVFGIGCIPMILIGIGLGILQRGGHLLSAFGASCLPAAVLVVAIMSGKNITKNAGAEGPSGAAIMWGGLAFLMVLTAFIYRKLSRS